MQNPPPTHDSIPLVPRSWTVLASPASLSCRRGDSARTEESDTQALTSCNRLMRPFSSARNRMFWSKSSSCTAIATLPLSKVRRTSS